MRFLGVGASLIAGVSSSITPPHFRHLHFFPERSFQYSSLNFATSQLHLGVSFVGINFPLFVFRGGGGAGCLSSACSKATIASAETVFRSVTANPASSRYAERTLTTVSGWSALMRDCNAFSMVVHMMVVLCFT